MDILKANLRHVVEFYQFYFGLLKYDVSLAPRGLTQSARNGNNMLNGWNWNHNISIWQNILGIWAAGQELWRLEDITNTVDSFH